MSDKNFATEQFKEMHSFMAMLQNLDVGLVVLNKSYQVQLWNNFMESHSGIHPGEIREKLVFDVFQEIDRDWFEHKAESVFQLGTRAFTTWEQRPYLFRFKNYRPITGSAEFMYQNVTIIPIESLDGGIDKIGIIVYDVTDIAVNRTELTLANNELKRLSRTDKLTGLYNRGFWEECLVNEFKRARRTGQASTLVMFDIDHFKKVNDKYGHPGGDAAIKHTADLLTMNMRETDIAGRYGGEEYAIILIGTSAKDSMTFVERVRKSIEDSIVTFHESEFQYTVSLGVAEIDESFNDHNDWIEASDHALYEAKENGRNNAMIFKPKV